MGNGIHSGQRFGKLVTLAVTGKDRDRKHWLALCDCDCGNPALVRVDNLKSGNSTNCGCERTEKARQRRLKHGHTVRAENNRSLTYVSWVGAKYRVFTPTCPKWDCYGGRGITMCQRYKNSFIEFLTDLGMRPKGMSIDRIDNDGHYSCGKCAECVEKGWPMNCRWATQLSQQRNRRSKNKWSNSGVQEKWAFKEEREAAL